MSMNTYLMSLNRCDSHIANMTHTAIMLNGQKDPIFLHMYAITQPNTMCTLHVIDKYGLATHMPLNMPDIQISSCATATTVSVNTTYELTGINSVSRSTGIHTFHITGTCP